MKVVVTGSSGLVGSEAVLHYDLKADKVIGVDNNMRADYFGPEGDTRRTLRFLQQKTSNFEPIDMDVRDRVGIVDLFKQERPDLTIHCAAQPSHDLAARRPYDDFDVNAVGTLNLLEATRQYARESPFVFISTSKVYGDAPNELPLQERSLRWDYADPTDYEGIDETCRIDQSKHSLFGASKLAGDVMTQESGRYFGMPTVCFRAGCITGPNHEGVEAHGFLSYLVKVAVRRKLYTVFGHKGKQVRDQIHSIDVVNAVEAYVAAPISGAVYNLGGGRQNSISILEAFRWFQANADIVVDHTYNKTHRRGDHICYISDTRKFQAQYPKWEITQTLDQILVDMLNSERERSAVG